MSENPMGLFHLHRDDPKADWRTIPLAPTLCGYGENCPLELHFNSAEEGWGYLDKLKEFGSEKPVLPEVPGLTGERALELLELIFSGVPASFRRAYPNFDPSNVDEDLTQQELRALRDAELINGQILIPFFGKDTLLKQGRILWYERARHFAGLATHARDYAFHSSLSITEEAEQLIDQADKARSRAGGARSELFDHLRDSIDLEEFEAYRAVIIDHQLPRRPDAVPAPAFTEKLADQARAIYAVGRDSLSFERIAELIGTSRQTASRVARTLAIYGILEKGYHHDPFGRARHITYNQLYTVVDSLGGLETVLESFGATGSDRD